MFEEDISGLFVNDIDTGSDDFELSEEETDALEAAYDDLDEEFDEAINEVEEVERALDEINVKRADQGYEEIDLDSAEESILKKKSKDDEFVIERRPVDPEFNDFLNKAHAKYGNPTKDPEFNKKSREFDSRYKSKAKEDAFGLFEDYDDYDDYDIYDGYDDAEEASANYNLKKAVQYNKKSAKNNYIASQKYKEISENPNVDEDDRRSAARKANYHMNMAKSDAGNAKSNDVYSKYYKIDKNDKYANKALIGMIDADATDEHQKSRKQSALSGKKRREAYDQANDIKNCKAKESAFDFGETGLFTTLFTPAYEAAEDYDDDDLLMDEELDEEIKDEPNDMIIDDDEEYSDSEYDKDEELDEE